MEGEHSIDKIIGIPEEMPDLAKKVDEYFEGRFEKQIDEYEIEKTPEQQELIKGVLSRCNEYLKEKYNIEPLNLNLDHFHFINVAKIPEEFIKVWKGSRPGGSFVQNHQRINIYIYPDRTYGNLKIAEIIVHEIIHANAFQSINVDAKRMGEITGWDYVPRRSGLSIIKQDKFKRKIPREDFSGALEEGVYFHELDEAVTEELTVRFLQEYVHEIPELEKDVEEFKVELQKVYSRRKSEKPDEQFKIKEEITGLEYGEGNVRVLVQPNAYIEFRNQLSRMTEKLAEHNPEKFSDKEEVFNFLAQRYFDGKLLELARLIEKTHGRGAFRKGALHTKKK